MHRIVLVMSSPGWGGVEKAVVDLANALSSTCDVTAILSPDARYDDRLASAVRVRRLRRGSRRNPLVLAHLRGLLRELQPDIVHTHAAKATEMVFWVGRTLRLHHVATKHNTRRGRIFSRVRWTTAVSEQVRDTIAGGRAEVVYNGIEPVPVTREAKPDVFTIVAVGRLDRYKGFDRLVRAVVRLPFECVLEIAGEGPERPALEASIAALGAGPRVRLLGHREDVPALLARAHLQVVPSRTEGFSLALIEGLHYCDLVVSTPVGIAPEILPEELLVDGDTLEGALAAVRERYDALKGLFRDVRARHARRFLLSSTVEAYLDVYRRALAEDGRAGA